MIKLVDLLNVIDLNDVVYVQDYDTNEVLYNDYVTFIGNFIKKCDNYYVVYIQNNENRIILLLVQRRLRINVI